MFILFSINIIPFQYNIHMSSIHNMYLNVTIDGEIIRTIHYLVA